MVCMGENKGGYMAKSSSKWTQNGEASSFEAFKTAIEKKDYKKLQQLIASGLDVNVQNAQGVTPLFLAANKNDAQMVHVLLQAGADVHHKTKAGQDVFLYAQNSFSGTFAKSMLGMASAMGDPNLKPGSRSETGTLSDFVEAGPMNGVMLLLYEKAGIYNAPKNKDKKTMLHLSVEAGLEKWTQKLIAQGADVNARTATGEMPLHLSVKSRYPETLQHLIKAGAGVNARDNQGNTPLMVAVKNRSYKSIIHLLKAGAYANDPWSKDEKRSILTVLDAELKAGHRSLYLSYLKPEDREELKAIVTELMNKKQLKLKRGVKSTDSIRVVSGTSDGVMRMAGERTDSIRIATGTRAVQKLGVKGLKQKTENRTSEVSVSSVETVDLSAKAQQNGAKTTKIQPKKGRTDSIRVVSGTSDGLMRMSGERTDSIRVATGSRQGMTLDGVQLGKSPRSSKSDRHELLLAMRQMNESASASEVAAAREKIMILVAKNKGILTEEDNKGYTPLELAAYNGNVPALSLFQKMGYQLKGADAETGVTLLHMAAMNGQVETVDWLTAYGKVGDINQKTVRGNSVADAALIALKDKSLDERKKNALVETTLLLMQKGGEVNPAYLKEVLKDPSVKALFEQYDMGKAVVAEVMGQQARSNAVSTLLSSAKPVEEREGVSVHSKREGRA